MDEAMLDGFAGSILPSTRLGHVVVRGGPCCWGECDWLVARIEQKKDLTLHEFLAQLREERGVPRYAVAVHLAISNSLRLIT